ARLPERQRTVLVLHDMDGIPMRQIAETLSVPLFTLYTRLRTGRRAFAKELRRTERLAGGPLAAEVLADQGQPPAPRAVRRRVTARLRALLAPDAAPPVPPAARGPAPSLTAAVAAALVAIAVLALDGTPRTRLAALAETAVAGPVAYWPFDD